MQIVPYCQQQKCNPLTLWIFTAFPREGSVKQQWGCRKWQFSLLLITISLEILEVMPALLYSIIQYPVISPLTPKYVTLNYLEQQFYIKFSFYGNFKFKVYLHRQCHDIYGQITCLSVLEVCVICIFIYIYDLQSMGVHKLTCFGGCRLLPQCTVCGNKKDPRKQISLFSVQFNIFLQNFQRLFPTQFAITVANFIVLPFVVQKQHSFEYKRRFFSTAQTNKSDYNQLSGIF